MEDSISSFLQHLIVERGFSRNTWEAYRNDLEQFHQFLGERSNGQAAGGNPWLAVDLNLLDQYITDLRDRKGYRDTTTARKVAAIKSFFSFLLLNGYIPEDPTESLGSPRIGRTLPKCLSEDDVTRLLDVAAQAASTSIPRTDTSRRRCAQE